MYICLFGYSYILPVPCNYTIVLHIIELGLMCFSSGTQWWNHTLWCQALDLLQSFSSWIANHFCWLAGYHMPQVFFHSPVFLSDQQCISNAHSRLLSLQASKKIHLYSLQTACCTPVCLSTISASNLAIIEDPFCLLPFPPILLSFSVVHYFFGAH